MKKRNSTMAESPPIYIRKIETATVGIKIVLQGRQRQWLVDATVLPTRRMFCLGELEDSRRTMTVPFIVQISNL